MASSFSRRGRRRFARTHAGRISVVLIGLILSAGLAMGAHSAVSDEGDLQQATKFSRVNLKALGRTGLFKPATIAGNQTTKVIVRFSGKSVGEQTAGKSVTKAQKAALRQQVKNQQDPIVARIKGVGATVTRQYQDVYNGAAVQVPLKDLGALANVDGVESIHPDRIVKIDNTAGVQYIGGDQAWQSSGKTGNNVKVAIIDTGVDYFHANFGGNGDPNDFKNDDHTKIEAGSFPTKKVVGGTDFVGDAYDANSSDPAINQPKPDPDPLDCNGHGSHTAGSAAGFGVLDNGSTYGGPYNNTTYSHTFRIGPGVAPKALIYAYRVFGCDGSASDSVIVDALNRAYDDGVDVVNMSLGSPFGRNDAPDSVAANTLADNGVVVVASAGNNGAGGYITGSPGAASRVLSVAAVDASSPTFPGATIALSTGKSILAQLSNGPFQNDPGASLPSGPLDVVVIRNSDGSVSLGCDQADYANAVGKLAVVLRGTCARVHKAIVGQKAGAAAVAMIDTSTGFPPFEGDVTSDPDTGEQFHLTIPFFGIRGLLSNPASDGSTLVAADGGKANSFTPTDVPNPSYQRAAGFSSGGPRNVDSAMKPEITAPGVSVKSTAVGTGNQGTRMSGTSMASPMTAGAAALLTEAHPGWSTEAIKAALINTAEGGTGKILSYNPRIAGSGVLQAQRAVNTVAYVTTTGGRDTLDFGYDAINTATFSQALQFTIHNESDAAITYGLTVAAQGIAPVTVSPSSITVPPHDTATGTATATAAAAGLPGAEASIFGTIQTARGVVVATPGSSRAGVYTLRVPYMFVPRGLSNVTAGAKSAYTTESSGDLSATIPVTNSGVHAGVADVYAWGITDADDTSGAEDSFDVRDVGVQLQSREFLCDPAPVGACGTADDRSLIFAINNWGRASNPSVNEFDIAIDKQNDGRPDAFVVGVDLGVVTTGDYNGQFASFIFDQDGNLVDAWVADAPMNGSTLELPALASQLGLNPNSPGSEKFNYWVNAFNIVPGALVDTTNQGTFRVDKSPVSTGQQVALAPGQSGTLNVTVDKGKFASAPQLGWLVATLDDANGAAQADEVPAGDVK